MEGFIFNTKGVPLSWVVIGGGREREGGREEREGGGGRERREIGGGGRERREGGDCYSVVYAVEMVSIVKMFL